MTKSEAKVVHEGASRALRHLHKAWTMEEQTFARLAKCEPNASLTTAIDEIERIAAMAYAEISK